MLKSDVGYKNIFHTNIVENMGQIKIAGSFCLMVALSAYIKRPQTLLILAFFWFDHSLALFLTMIVT